MSLEPVILNEVQLKAAETQTKIDTQTQTLIADSATKRDEINSTTQTAKDEVKSHVTSEVDRVIAATGSDGGRYGHEVIISVGVPRNVSIRSDLPLVITPPSGCFVRITLLYSNAGQPDVFFFDTSKSTLPLYINGRSSANYHLFGAGETFNSRTKFRIGGRAAYESTSSERGDGINPLQYFDGAIGQPLRIISTSGNNATVQVAHQIIRVE